MKSDARTEILERVRAGLAKVSRSAAPAAYRATSVPPAERIARFTQVLEGVGGRVHRARDLAAARTTLHAILAEHGARRLIVSDAPAVLDLGGSLQDVCELFLPTAPRAALLTAEAGLSGAQWGIAETGTLVLESAREQHRLASLLAPVHVALLPLERLLGTLGEVFSALQGPTGAPASRTITFVTGPSRTADIELELVVGVHGPKHLHVVLLDSPLESTVSPA